MAGKKKKSKKLQKKFHRTRRNLGQYQCGQCGKLGHNKRTCKSSGSGSGSGSRKKVKARTSKFAVLNYAISRDVMWSIHAAGCKDISRDQQEHGAFIQEVAGSLEDAINAALDEETRELGWDEDAVRVHNCAKKI